MVGYTLKLERVLTPTGPVIYHMFDKGFGHTRYSFVSCLYDLATGNFNDTSSEAMQWLRQNRSQQAESHGGHKKFQ